MGYTSISKINWQRCLKSIKYIYMPLIFICFLSFVFQNRLLLSDLFHQAKLNQLVYAIFTWMTLHLLAPFSSLIFFKAKNYSIHYKTLLAIYITRLPARYLPGGIWHTVARMHDYHFNGVSKKDISQLALFETVFPIPFSFFTGTLLLKITSFNILPDKLLNPILFISLPVLLLPFYFCKFLWRDVNTPRKYYLLILILSFIFWFVASLAFFLYLHSFSFQSNDNNSFLSVTGAYILSWGVGYITIFAPQGIGVFEVVMAKMIALPINLGSSVAFLAGFRLVALIADFIIFFIYKLLRSNSEENDIL